MTTNNRLLMILLAGAGLLVLIGVVFLLIPGGEEQAQTAEQPVAGVVPVQPGKATPSPTASKKSEATPRKRALVIVGVAGRDPFRPLVQPDTSDESKTSSDTSDSSSSSSSSKSTKSTGVNGKQSADSSKSKSTQPSGSDSNDSEKKKTDDSGSKAPEPIGGGGTGEDAVEQVEVTVVDVADSMAVVRVNNTRTTLYLNVADPSGVTYVSSLGGGCGWFTKAELQERFTICEGETRQL